MSQNNKIVILVSACPKFRNGESVTAGVISSQTSVAFARDLNFVRNSQLPQ